MLGIGMRQYDDKWKAYCGWCNRVIAICRDEREGEKELLWHRWREGCDVGKTPWKAEGRSDKHSSVL